MRSGGISGKNLKSYWISTIEILKSFKINNLSTNILFIIMRIPAKIVQLFIYNKNLINSTFKLFKFKFENNYYQENSFKIIDNVQKIPFGSKFYFIWYEFSFFRLFCK